MGCSAIVDMLERIEMMGEKLCSEQKIRIGGLKS